MVDRQTIKPRVRVHAANNQFSKGGFYYVVHGDGVAVGNACINHALSAWHDMRMALQTYRPVL